MGGQSAGFRMVVRGDPSGPDVATLQEPVELVRNLLSGLMTVLGIWDMALRMMASRSTGRSGLSFLGCFATAVASLAERRIYGDSDRY